MLMHFGNFYEVKKKRGSSKPVDHHSVPLSLAVLFNEQAQIPLSCNGNTNIARNEGNSGICYKYSGKIPLYAPSKHNISTLISIATT